MVYCGKCGGKLFHKTDNTRKHSETWYCKSNDCTTGIPMSIAELEIEIISILNQLIDDPFLAEQTEPEMTIEPSLELQRIENELERKLESLDFDKNNIQYLILQCAAKKYNEHKSSQHIMDRMKADFEKSSLLSNFNMELFDRTVSAVIMDSNKAVSLKLKNNKIIGREPQSHDNTSTDHVQNGQSHSAETGILR